MGQNKCEKILKYSIKGWKHRGEIVGGCLIKDPKFKAHPVDAIIIDHRENNNIIECKETCKKSISYSSFSSDEQRQILASGKHNWVLVRFFEDVPKNNKRWAQDWFLVPGKFVPQEAGAEGISFDRCIENEAIYEIARERKGRTEGIKEELGFTSRGTRKKGFEEFGPIV